MTRAHDCAELERTHALADGELTGTAADAARDHLATCASCQAALADLLQLDAAVAARPRVVPLAWYRRRKRQVAAAAVAVAAAVAIYLALPRPGAPVAPAVALAPHRVTEARLAWSGAAAFRAYDVPRAGESPHESVALAVRAELERRGDLHGIGALALLNGERREAARFLERAGESADVLADRAALALADGQPERALALADAALAFPGEPGRPGPGRGAALWNRGLALRDLGLLRAAAAAFGAVVALAEPGWGEEARQRAAAIDAAADVLARRFERLNQASVALARGQITLSIEDARAMPGFARGILYDAIRSATGPDQLAALAPLASAIDAADGDTAMAGALARAGKALHPALSRQYGEMIRALAVAMQITPAAGDEAPVPAGAARAQLLAALRAARADDLLIGVLMKTSDDLRVVNRAEIAEFARLTAASPDPWMQLLGLQQAAEVALAADDMVGAESILLRARQRCAQPGAPAFRCVSIGRLLGQLYVAWVRLPEARAALAAAWQAARASGEWVLQDALLDQLALAASRGDEAEGGGLPLVAAYSDELVLRYPADEPAGRCNRAARGRDLRAMLLIDRLQFSAARGALAGPACPGPQAPERAATHLFIRSELAGRGTSANEVADIAEVAELRRQIAALRDAPDTHPAERVLLDHSEGRLLIDRDPAAAQALLRRAIEAARSIPAATVRAHAAAAWSYSVLAVAAARRGDGDAALALLAEEQGLALPGRCALGVAIEDQRRAVVVRDAAGATFVRADDGRTAPAIDPRSLVPGDLAARLGACRIVDVIARPPIHGMSRLLPDAIAWRYLARRAGAPAPAGLGSLVVADVEPPAALELPRLATWAEVDEHGSRRSRRSRLSGPAATPSKVLAAIGLAEEVIVHAHALVDVAQPDASFLALSAEPDGRFALTTGDVRRARFTASPLVILAACHASRAAPLWHETWSLPAAFVYAGARAVIASAAPIPDADAAGFFDAVRAAVAGGVPVAAAVRDTRQAWLAQHRDGWVRDVIVFE